MTVPRYRLTLEYDGGAFVGWQRQTNGLSVQEALEKAVFGFSGEQVTAVAAGRTDSGVHALAQVAHIDLDRGWPAATVRDALNFHLNLVPLSVLEAAEAPPGFHARFSATARRYLYRIVNRRARPGLDQGRVWHVVQPLDVAAMGAAARHLVGRHDFTTFRSSRCQAASPVKTLNALEVGRVGEEVRIETRGRSFLHHQVRAMVGTLKLVGEGKWTAEDVVRALDAHNRSACGPTAPACGLYLVGVDYEEPAPE